MPTQTNPQQDDTVSESAHLLVATDTAHSTQQYDATAGAADVEAQKPENLPYIVIRDEPKRRMGWAKVSAGISAGIDSALTSLSLIIFGTLIREPNEEDEQFFWSKTVLIMTLWLIATTMGSRVRWEEFAERAEGHEEHDDEPDTLPFDASNIADQIVRLWREKRRADFEDSSAQVHGLGEFLDSVDKEMDAEEQHRTSVLEEALRNIPDELLRAKVSAALQTVNLEERQKIIDVLETTNLREKNETGLVLALYVTAIVEGLDGALACRLIYPSIDSTITLYKALATGFGLGVANFLRYLYADGSATWLIITKKNPAVKELPHQLGMQTLFAYSRSPALFLREFYPGMMGFLAGQSFHDMALEIFNLSDNLPLYAWQNILITLAATLVMSGTSFFAAHFDMGLMMKCLSQSLAHMHEYPPSSAMSRSQYLILRMIGKVLNGEWLMEPLEALARKCGSKDPAKLATAAAAALNAAGEVAIADDAMEENIADNDRAGIEEGRKALALMYYLKNVDQVVSLANGPGSTHWFGFKGFQRWLALFMGMSLTKAEFGTVLESFRTRYAFSAAKIPSDTPQADTQEPKTESRNCRCTIM